MLLDGCRAPGNQEIVGGQFRTNVALKDLIAVLLEDVVMLCAKKLKVFHTTCVAVLVANVPSGGRPRESEP